MEFISDNNNTKILDRIKLMLIYRIKMVWQYCDYTQLKIVKIIIVHMNINMDNDDSI